MKEKRLLDELIDYSQSGVVPMHMPGHKRNAKADYLDILNAQYDITEIDGFDNLHSPEGILKDVMDKATKLYKSSNTYFLINGSTCGILAGMKACLKHGDEIIMARNCHKSVYHGVELLGLTPYFLYPERVEIAGGGSENINEAGLDLNKYENKHENRQCDKQNSICGQIEPVKLEELLQTHPNVKLVIITSPTYEGIISDIKELSKVAHKYNIPLMVDAAHGAHMGFNDYFGPSAVSEGADIVINSLHKTMPSLTQTALAHVNGCLVNEKEFARCLSIFETSSPSYLLMASIDGCVSLVAEKGEELFAAYESRVRRFYEEIKGLKRLKVLKAHMIPNNQNKPKVLENPVQIDGEECRLCERDNELKECINKDPGKIVVFTKGIGISGVELSKILRSEYKIEVEMASLEYIIAMTGLMDTDENLCRLAEALNEIDSELEKQEKNIYENEVIERVLGDNSLEYSFTIIDEQFGNTASDYLYKIEEAIGMAKRRVFLSDAVGHISGEYVWAYPPGIPILIPGQVIKEEDVRGIMEMMKSGVNVCRG